MAEDYNCPRFNSYGGLGLSSSDIDDCGIYIKNIPVSLSYDAFVALMSENGRKIVRSKLYPPRENQDVTVGLVSFEKSKDAADVIRKYNKKAPFHMDINYCQKRKGTSKKGLPLESNNIALNSHSNQRSLSSLSENVNPAPVSGKGRGYVNSSKFPTLRIVLDGDKRTSYAPKNNVEESKLESLDESDIPKLVDNPFLTCLACDNVGQFSCDNCKKPYCSQRCQVDDWPKHKLLCKSISVTEKKSNEGAASVNKNSRDSSYVSESSSSESDKACASSIPKRHTPARTTAATPEKPPSAFKVEDIKTSTLPSLKHVQVKVCHVDSPSKFWVHLKSAESLLSQMELDLTLYIKKTPSKFEAGHVYCTLQGEKFKRVNIISAHNSKSSKVQFLDYGDIAVVQNDKLYLLPELFKEVPCQAICCKLVDTGTEKDIVWSEEDTTYFQMNCSENKYYTAYVYEEVNNVFEVNLTNDYGVSLYLNITGLKNLDLSQLKGKDSDCNGDSLKPVIPSVWSSLKEDSQVTLIGVEFTDDRFWGVLDDGSGVAENVIELENALRNLKTKEVNMYVEEGDIVAGLSVSYNEFYRCCVLKRMRERFLVQYIDYGNKEEITKLCELTPELLKMCCYTVCCTKPQSMFLDQVKSLFSNSTVMTVKIFNGHVKLSVNHNNTPLLFDCYPWHHGLNKTDSTSKLSHLKKGVLPVKQPLEKIASVPPSAVSEKSVEKRITGDLIKDISVAVGNKYDVKVEFIVNASKIYVQLKENAEKLIKLSDKLNEYCSTMKTEKYSPIRNEIVCCKFKADSKWYRGQVIGKKKNIYTVFFIDYGNEDLVSEEDMKPLPQFLSSYKLALCVSLHNVKNDDISRDLLAKLVEEYWEMTVLDALVTPIQVMLFQKEKSFVDFINNQKTRNKSSLSFQKLPPKKSEIVVCHTVEEKVFVQQTKDIVAVENLCSKMNSVTTKMSAIKIIKLNNLCCALFSDGLWYRASIDKELSSGKYQVTSVDFGYQESLSVENLKEIPDEFLKLPVFCIPLIPQNIKSSQLRVETKYSVEVTDEISGTQVAKFLDFERDLLSLASFKKSSLPVGLNEVVFCHSKDDAYFCLQKSDIEDAVSLSKKLQQCAKETLPSEALSKGKVVCAKNKEGSYFRGAVEKICDKNSYLLSSIDFGNTELIDSESIYPLSFDFLKYPVFCIPVKIANFEKAKRHVILNSPLSVKTFESPINGVQLVEIVLPKSSCELNISSFKKQHLPLDTTSDISICHNEGSIFYAHMSSDHDQIKALELKLQSAEQYETLSELPEVGSVVCAKFSDGAWYRGSVEESSPSSSVCKICFIDYGNFAEISISNMKVLPAEYSAYPVFSIPVRFSNLEKLQEQVQTGASVFSVQVLSNSNEGIQLVKVIDPEVKREIKSINQLRLTDLPVEVIVCHAEGDIFYVQRVSDEEALKDMMMNLQSCNCSEKLQYIPKVGELLCVKYSDGLWYRGIVKKDCSGGIFKVFFCDFGNTDDMSLKDMCLLPSSDSLPMFSIPIKLSSVSKKVPHLEIDSKYIVKSIGTTPDNIQIVKVRPDIQPVLVTSLKSSELEDCKTAVCFQNFDGKYHHLIKCQDNDKMAEMNKLLKDFEGDEIFETPNVGELVVVKGGNKKWHRGGILSTNENPGHCQVFLLDEGIAQEISFSNICYMSKQFTSYPVYSIKVLVDTATKILFGKQYNVSVVSKDNGIPVVQVISQYMLYSLEQRYLPLNFSKKVKFYHKENDVLYLQISDDFPQFLELLAEVQTLSSEKCISYKAAVGELLVAQSSLDNIWYRGCVEEVMSSDSYKIRFIDFGNTEIVPRGNLHNFTKKLCEHPPFSIAVKICSSFLNVILDQEYIVKAVNKPERTEAQLIEIVNESNQTEVLVQKEKQFISETPANSSKKYYFGDCSYVDFPSGEQEIVIYTVMEKCYIFCTPFNKENILATEQLTKDITKHCTDFNVSSYEGTLPEVDEMVLAKYEESWYRAVIVDDKCAPLYDVLFVDYGNSERIPLMHIRKTCDEFMSLNIQAHLCHLSGFDYNDANMDQITEEIMNNFTYRAEPLKAKVIVSEKDIEVCIEDVIEHLRKKKLIS